MSSIVLCKFNLTKLKYPEKVKEPIMKTKDNILEQSRRNLESMLVNSENLAQLCQSGLRMLKPSKPAAGKSRTGYFFDKWLNMMEFAYDELSKQQFAELEGKIMQQIRSRRNRRTK